MTVRVLVHQRRHLQLVRFISHPEVFRDMEYAVVDDHLDHGYGYTAITPELRSTATIRLAKMNVSSRAHLEIVSALPGASLRRPSNGVLPRDGYTADVQLTATPPSSDSVSAELDVRIVPPDVPAATVIYRLNVKVFRLRRVRIAFHRVAALVGGATVLPAFPADLSRVLDVANSVWRQHGIQIMQTSDRGDVTATYPEVYSPIATPIEGEGASASRAGDVAGLQAQAFADDAINVYLVHRFAGIWAQHATTDMIGMTFNAWNTVVRSGQVRKGIMLQAVHPDGSPAWQDEASLGLGLAHEIGHFFNMSHPHDDPPADVPASRFLLMHNVMPVGTVLPLWSAVSGLTLDTDVTSRSGIDYQPEIEQR